MGRLKTPSTSNGMPQPPAMINGMASRKIQLPPHLRYYMPHGRNDPCIYCQSAGSQRTDAPVDLHPMEQFQHRLY